MPNTAGSYPPQNAFENNPSKENKKAIKTNFILFTPFVSLVVTLIYVAFSAI